MKIPWSPGSAEDLEQIFNYIRTDNPGAAQRVAQTVYDRAAALGADPYPGAARPGGGTRELPSGGRTPEMFNQPAMRLHRIADTSAIFDLVTHRAQIIPLPNQLLPPQPPSAPFS